MAAAHGPAGDLTEDQKEMLAERQSFYKGACSLAMITSIVCFALTFAVIFAIKGVMWAFALLMLGIFGYVGVTALLGMSAER